MSEWRNEQGSRTSDLAWLRGWPGQARPGVAEKAAQPAKGAFACAKKKVSQVCTYVFGHLGNIGYYYYHQGRLRS